MNQPDAHAEQTIAGPSTSETAAGWTDSCPYLRDATGTWRAARPTRDHRCMAVTPPAPLRTEKQRGHCLSAGHVECAVFVAAAEIRVQLLGNVADPAHGPRRVVAQTVPVLIERPAAISVALASLRASLPQVGLVVLMLLGLVALALARFVNP